MKIMNKVDINALINKKKLIIKVLGTTFFFFCVILASSYNFDIYMFSKEFVNTPLDVRQIRGKANNFIKDKINLEYRENFSNNGSVAKLGNDTMNLSLDIYNTEIDISDIEEPEKKEFEEIYPQEMDADSQEIYEDNIQDEHKNIIKNYFNELKGEGD